MCEYIVAISFVFFLLVFNVIVCVILNEEICTQSNTFRYTYERETRLYVHLHESLINISEKTKLTILAFETVHICYVILDERFASVI